MRAVARYGAETWTLRVTEGNALRMFERKIIRKIYGPVMENNIRSIGYKEAINSLLKGEDIARFIKSQRIRWLGHIDRMEDNAIFRQKERKTQDEVARRC
jgi:hypothetical protein